MSKLGCAKRGKYEVGLLCRSFESKERNLRLLWIFVVGLCTTACFIHTVLLAIKYLDEGVISTYNPRGIRFQFPDIFLCHEVPLAESFYLDQRKNNSTEFQRLMKDFDRVNSIQRKIWDNMGTGGRLKEGLFLWETIDWKRILDLLGHRKHQTVIGHFSNEGKLNMTSVREVFHRLHKRCFLAEVPHSSSEFLGSNHATFTIFQDPIHTEEFRRFIKSSGVSSSNYWGIRLYLVARGTLPSRETEFIRIKAGYFYDIRVRMTQTILYNTRSRPCNSNHFTLVNPVDSIALNNSSMFQECVDRALQRLALNQCECYILDLTRGLLEPDVLRGSAPCLNVSQFLAGDGGLTNQLKNLSTSINCYLKVKLAYPNIAAECQNVISCNTTEYSSVFSYIPWPIDTDHSGDVVRTLQETTSTYRESEGLSIPGLDILLNGTVNDPNLTLKALKLSLSEVKITSMESYSSTHVERLQYLITNLLSDCGGVLNLYLGISIVTLFKFGLDFRGFIHTYYSRKTAGNILMESNRSTLLSTNVNDSVEDKNKPPINQSVWI